MTSTIRRLLPVFLAAFGLVLASATAASAQTKLRWNLKKGEKLQFSKLEEVKMIVMLEGTPINTSIKQDIYCTWQVGGKSDKGVSQVTQTIDRVVMKTTSPFFSFNYDSADKQEAQGIAKQIGVAVKNMIGKEMSFKIGSRGQLSDVKPPVEVAGALKGSLVTAQIATEFSESALKQVFGQLGASLPEKSVAKGDRWTDTIHVEIPNMGKMKTTITYTYQGTELRDGQKIEKLLFSTKTEATELKGPGGIKMKLKEQKGSGVLYFDNTKGRATDSTFNLELKMEITVAGKSIETTVDSK
ncbi:MAG: hypothetical protein IIA67_02195, partial [Planctomycetes bacterium]|nr:hypothetical protein [Planctomycetota bacterium]